MHAPVASEKKGVPCPTFKNPPSRSASFLMAFFRSAAYPSIKTPPPCTSPPSPPAPVEPWRSGSWRARFQVGGRELRGRPNALPRPLLVTAVQIADGLAKAHEAGIKSENVMVTRDGLVKILEMSPETTRGSLAPLLVHALSGKACRNRLLNACSSP